MKLKIYVQVLGLTLLIAGCTPAAAPDSAKDSSDKTATEIAKTNPEDSKVAKKQDTAKADPKNPSSTPTDGKSTNPTDVVKEIKNAPDDAAPKLDTEADQKARYKETPKKQDLVAEKVAAEAFKAQQVKETADQEVNRREQALKARDKKKDSVMSKAVRSTNQSEFVGKWSYDLSPTQVKFIQKMAADAKKKGLPFTAPQSIINIMPNGKFTLSEVMQKNSRAIGGSYTFTNGTLTLKYETVNGKPPVSPKDKAGLSLVLTKEKKLMRTDTVTYVRAK